MTERRWLYFALGVTMVISIGAVTNQLVPLASSGVAVGGTGITFPDATVQTTAAGNPDPPCFNNLERFVDCGNGTVTDTATGLIYLRNANCFGAQTWPAANQSAAGLADGSCGLTDGSRAGDWRLQTREEWGAILDSSCTTDPEIVGNQYPTQGCYTDGTNTNSEWASGVQLGFYWSSSTDVASSYTAWVAGMTNGLESAKFKTLTYSVWPVRDG